MFCSSMMVFSKKLGGIITIDLFIFGGVLPDGAAFSTADSSTINFSVATIGKSHLNLSSRIDFEIITGWVEGPWPYKAIILYFGRDLVPPIFLILCGILMFPVTVATEMIIVLGYPIL